MSPSYAPDNFHAVRDRLDIAAVLERMFDLYRARATVLLPSALIVFAIIDLVAGLAINGGFSIIRTLIYVAVLAVGGFWYQGVVVETVAETRVPGRRPQITDLFRTVEPHLPALLGAGLLAGVAIGIGYLLLVVPGLLLLTWWALLAPVIVVEGRPMMAAFGRSRELVRGNGWRVFGVVLVVFLIQAAVTALLAQVGSGFIVHWLTSLLATVLTAPLAGLAAAIMYFDLEEINEPGALRYSPETAPEEPPAAAAGFVEPFDHETPAHDSAPSFEEPLAAHDAAPAFEAEPHATHEPAPAFEPEPHETPAFEEPGAAREPDPVEELHPADWYPDPHGEARLRYWDGSRWTDYTAE